MFVRVNGHKIPVDVIGVAEYCGFDIVECRLGDTAGFLCVADSKKLIYVNEQSRTTRQRFTVAHELGHHLLGHRTTGFARFNCYQERKANIFAAELLMPGVAAGIIWGKIKAWAERAESESSFIKLPPEWMISTFVDKFKVSILAAKIRLKSLGFIKNVVTREGTSVVSLMA